MITAETVNRIVRFSSAGVPVVSLYGRVDPAVSRHEVRTRMLSLLDQIRPRGQGETLDHRSRRSVRADIERIEATLSAERWHPGGIAIFSCSARDLYQEIPLPSPVREQAVVDATPFVLPMLSVLGEYRRACVLLLDKGSAPFWEVYQDEIQELGTVRDPLARAATKAAADWTHDKADERVRRHYRRIVRVLSRLFLTGGYDVLIIGGHAHELPDFLRFLPYELRIRVAGTFTAEPAAASAAEIRACASVILRRHQLRLDEQLISRLLEKAATAGPAALGPDSCLRAGSMGAIKTLLVRDGAAVPGVVCDDSRWLALSGDDCPVCGGRTRRTADVIVELVAAVIGEGGSVRHAQADTRLDEYLVAAELRFPVPATW